MKALPRHACGLFARSPLTFKYKDLVENGLLKIKEYESGEFEGYKVLKYTRKAFYKGLWTSDLLECRGLVVDHEDDIVIYPFTKVFNYGEQGLEKKKTSIDRDRGVISVEKINGFMLAMSKLPDGTFLYSSTGTLDSDFVKMGREVVEGQCHDMDDLPYGMTFIFEICHETDPHIVEEKEGAYLIGARVNKLGSVLFTEKALDDIASDIGAHRPSWKEYKRFSDAKKDADKSEREGVMIRSPYGLGHLCKIKSKHYLSKKFIMRGKAEKIWDGKVDEDYADVVDLIKQAYTEDEWNDLDQMARRLVFENALEVLENEK